MLFGNFYTINGNIVQLYHSLCLIFKSDVFTQFQPKSNLKLKIISFLWVRQTGFLA